MAKKNCCQLVFEGSNNKIKKFKKVVDKAEKVWYPLEAASNKTAKQNLDNSTMKQPWILKKFQRTCEAIHTPLKTVTTGRWNACESKQLAWSKLEKQEPRPDTAMWKILGSQSLSKKERTLNMRVWSWLRMNAGGVPNTCKSNGTLNWKFSDGRDKV